jgi:hypothetical protein
MKVFSVKVDMLKVEPLFVLGCTEEAMRAYVRRRFRLHLEMMSPEVAGRMYTLHRAPWRLVWTATLDAPVVLHELFHLVTRICDDKGIVIRAHNERGENDDETAAYLFECLARQVLKRCRR